VIRCACVIVDNIDNALTNRIRALCVSRAICFSENYCMRIARLGVDGDIGAATSFDPVFALVSKQEGVSSGAARHNVVAPTPVERDITCTPYKDITVRPTREYARIRKSVITIGKFKNLSVSPAVRVRQ
jgi:hypothetical protein